MILSKYFIPLSVSQDKPPQLHKVTLLVGVAPVGSLPTTSQFLESVFPLDGDICKYIPWRVQRLVISLNNIISKRNRVDDTAKKGLAVGEKSSFRCWRAIGSVWIAVQGAGQDGPNGPVCPSGLGHRHRESPVDCFLFHYGQVPAGTAGSFHESWL